jgi:single-strand DNA-binding protein
MINSVAISGRITKDLDLRKTQSGVSVLSFTLAVNKKFKQADQPDADFINCVAFNKTADFMSKYLGKGSLIGVEGRIQTRNYEDKSGNRVYVTEVIAESVSFLESKRDSEQARDNASNHEQEFGSNSFSVESDDLPF